jgi:hypothetical protein
LRSKVVERMDYKVSKVIVLRFVVRVRGSECVCMCDRVRDEETEWRDIKVRRGKG